MELNQNGNMHCSGRDGLYPPNFFSLLFFLFPDPRNSILHAKVVVEGLFVCVSYIYGFIHRCKTMLVKPYQV